MPITVDWSNSPKYRITVPLSELTPVTGTQYSITVDYFWNLLRDFSDSEEALPFPVLYTNTPPTSSTPRIVEVNEDYYDLVFEDGLYSVEVIDGNTNIRDVEVKNQVSVGTNNTTGFINPTFLELALFQGGVCIDPQNATGKAVNLTPSGKTAAGDLIGTPSAPTLTVADSVAIAIDRGLNTLIFMSNGTISGDDLSAGYMLKATRLQVTIAVEPSADVSNCEFQHCCVEGELDGLNRIFQCEVKDVSSVSGEIFQCGIRGDISVSGHLHIFQSYSDVSGANPPRVYNINSQSLIIRDYRGSVNLAGITGGDHSIGIYGGQLTLEATCTGGTVHSRGDPFAITNLGSSTLLDETANSKTTEMHKRLDLNVTTPNTYADDASSITNSDFTLTRSDNGNGTSTVTRS